MALIYQGQEVVWMDQSVRIFGSKMIGLRGVKHGFDLEKEPLYADGNKIMGIQTGNEKLTGSVKILKNDFDKLNDAAKAAGYQNICYVPYQLIVITVNYKSAFGRPMRTDTLTGVAFSAYEKALEQNAKMMEIELPFIYMDLEEQ